MWPNLYFGILKSTFELSVFCKVFAAFLYLNSLSLLKHLRCGWEYRSLEQDWIFLCIKGFMCFDIYVWSAFLSPFFFFFFTYSQYILLIYMFFFTLSHSVLRGRHKRFHSLKLLPNSVSFFFSIMSLAQNIGLVFYKVLQGGCVLFYYYLFFCSFCSNRKVARLLKLQERSTPTLRKASSWQRWWSTLTSKRRAAKMQSRCVFVPVQAYN